MKQMKQMKGLGIFLPIGMSLLFASCDFPTQQTTATQLSSSSAALTAAPPCLFNGQTVASGLSLNVYSASSLPYGSSCASVAETILCSNGSFPAGTYFSTCSVTPPASCALNGVAIGSGGSIIAYQASTVPYGSSCLSQTRTCTNGTLDGSYSYGSCTVSPAAPCTFNGSTIANGGSVTAYQASTVPYGSSCVSQSRVCANGTLSGSYTASTCTPGAPASCTFNGQTIASGASTPAYTAQTVPYGSSCTSVATSLLCTNGSFPAGTYYPSCSVSSAASCTFNGNTVPSGNSVTAYQTATVPYGSTCASQSITCTNGKFSGTYTFPACTTLPAPVPTITSFAASSPAIIAGGSSVLKWSVSGETQISISGLGPVSGDSVTVTPTSTTTYTLTATNAVGSVNQTVTVAVETPSLVFVQQPQGAVAGANLPEFSVSAVDQSGNPLLLPDGTVCNLVVVSNPASGLIEGTHEDVVTSSGIATFAQVLFNVAGTYTLQARCSGVSTPSATSSPFTIATGPLANLTPSGAWPSVVVSGNPFGQTFAVTDAYGNPISSGTVSASITGEFTPGVTLGGTTTASVNAGVAAFTNLTVTSSSDEVPVSLFFALGSVSVTSPSITLVQNPPSIVTGGSFYEAYQILSSGNGIYLATDGGIFESTDQGNTFAKLPGLSSVKNVQIANGLIFALTGKGLFVSKDGGQTFIASNLVPVVPTAPDITGISVADFQGLIYLVGAVGLPCVTTPCSTGSIWVSSDGGVTFAPLSSKTANQLGTPNQVLTLNDSLYVNTNLGGTFSTTDGTTFSLDSAVRPVYGFLAVLYNQIYPIDENNFYGLISSVFTTSSSIFVAYNFGSGYLAVTTNGVLFNQIFQGYQGYFTGDSKGNIYQVVNGAGSSSFLAVSIDGGHTFKNKLFVQPAVAPIIEKLSVSPSILLPGDTNKPQLAWTLNGTLSYSVNQGSKALYTQSIAPSLDFQGGMQVSVPSSTTTYTLSATNPNGTVTSQASVWVAAQINFLATPPALTPGTTFSLKTQIVDANGNPDPSVSELPCTLAVASGPSGGSLGGPTTVYYPMSGVYNFTGLNFSTPGTYLLTETCQDGTGGSLSANSSAIVVYAPSQFSAKLSPSGRVSGATTLTAAVSGPSNDSIQSVSFSITPYQSKAAPVLVGTTSASGAASGVSLNTQKLTNGPYTVSISLVDQFGDTLSQVASSYIVVDNSSQSTTPEMGGPAGIGYPMDLAPNGSSLYGFYVRYGVVLDNLGAIWVSSGPNPTSTYDGVTHGGTGGYVAQSVTCPDPSYAVTGLNGCTSRFNGSTVLEALQLVCEQFTTGATITTGALEGTGGCPYGYLNLSTQCPPNEVAIGIQGYSGIYNDQIALVCQ